MKRRQWPEPGESAVTVIRYDNHYRPIVGLQKGEPGGSLGTEMEKRWDTDERGRGIGTARQYVSAVERLAADMSSPDWIAEEPEIHLLPHLRAAIDAESKPWRILSTSSGPDGIFTVELSWLGARPTHRALRSDFFALLGAIAESSTHVRERRSGNSLEFEVATGLLDGDGGWRGHGHLILFRVGQSTATPGQAGRTMSP